MFGKTFMTAALAGGLAFGIGMPAHAAEACTTTRVLVTAAVEGSAAVYGDAPLITPAQDAWSELRLISPAVDEVSHIVRHAAVYDERVVIDQPYVPAVPPVEEKFHYVHHKAVTTEVEHAAVTKVVHHEAVTKPVEHAAVTKVVHHDAVTKQVEHAAVTKVVHHDAVTKVVHHAAVTTDVEHPAETTQVQHSAVTKTVQHPAETTQINHPAETETQYQRYSWTGGKSGPGAGSTPVTEPDNWQSNNKKYDGSEVNKVFSTSDKGNASYFYWLATEVVTKAAWTETVVTKAAWTETVVVTPAWTETVVTKAAWTETVVIKAAYDETVVVTPAWDETVVVTPAWTETVVVTPAWDETVVVTPAWTETVVVTPAWDEKIVTQAAQPGQPEQPEVSHIERVLVQAAWDEKVIDVEAKDAVYETIQHPAVAAVYGDPVLITAAVEAKDAVYEDVEVCEDPEGNDPDEQENEGPKAILSESPFDHGTDDSDAAPLPQTAAVHPAQLAQTGGTVSVALPIGAGLLVAGGVALVATRRSRREAR